MYQVILLFLVSAFPLFSASVGNPAEPFFSKGSEKKGAPFFSFRGGYLSDHVYRQSFQKEFSFLEGEESDLTHIQVTTQALSLIMNLKRQFDVYLLLGVSRLELIQEAYGGYEFCYGIGAKMVLVKYKNLVLGGDAKYVTSKQKPYYFISEGYPYNVLGSFHLQYTETQGSLGISYLSSRWIPFVNLTYIHSRIAPTPTWLSVRLPNESVSVLVPSQSIISGKLWGWSLGASWRDGGRCSFSFEWRGGNQNAFYLGGTLRF